MRRPTLAVAGLLVASTLLSLTACTADDPQAKEPVRPSPTASSETEPAETATAEPSVDEPPKLDETETVAASQSKGRGSRSIEFAAGKKGDALIVAIRCQGEGKIDVTVKPANVSFPLECTAEEVTTTYNQVSVARVEDKGTVSVQAGSAVRWSLTIGRGEAAEAEVPGNDDA